MARSRPSVFVGSSTEGLKIAKALQVLLDHACEATIWSQGVFGLSQGTLESLVHALDQFDYAALVLTADDQLSEAAQGFDSAAVQMQKLVKLIARSRKVELDIISSQFGPLIAPDKLRQMNHDLLELEETLQQMKTLNECHV